MSAPPLFSVRALRAGDIGPLDCNLAAGECIALAGPSGAGKTRLLRAMADLDEHAGECRLAGQSAAAMPAHRWRAQVMFLAAETRWWHNSAREHLPAERSELRDWCAALDLDAGLLDAPLTRLSSGQRQRLALLRTLARRPRVLLLDEPTANLDADNARRAEALVADYLASAAAACLWVAHDAAQRQRVAAREIALDAAGRVASCS